jgi:hypothetical protein
MEMLVKPVLAINMPWYEGRVEIKTLGFGQDDEDIVRQFFQLAGQQDLSQFGIDARRLVESRGFPMRDPLEVDKQQKAAAKQIDQVPPPLVTPTQGRRALVTQTGFGEYNYHQIEDPIFLSQPSDGDFVANLPRTATWESRAVIDVARTLRSNSSDTLGFLYRDFAIYVSKRDINLYDENDEGLELSIDDKAARAAQRLVERWTPSVEKVKSYAQAVRASLGRAYDKTASLHLSSLRSRARVSQTDEEAAKWLDERGAQLVTGVLQTTRDELATFMADLVRQGKDKKEIADEIRTHFSSFPDIRATAIARTEIGEAYNYATVRTGLATGVKKAQLVDGKKDSCASRNGKIVNLEDALKERLNHTNCTFFVRLLPKAPADLEVRRTRLDGDHLARYDEDAHVVLLDHEVDNSQESDYLLALGEKTFV